MVCVLSNRAIFEKAPVGDGRQVSTKDDRGTSEVIILADEHSDDGCFAIQRQLRDLSAGNPPPELAGREEGSRVGKT
jgi:hypothetical protein